MLAKWRVRSVVGAYVLAVSMVVALAGGFILQGTEAISVRSGLPRDIEGTDRLLAEIERLNSGAGHASREEVACAWREQKGGASARLT